MAGSNYAVGLHFVVSTPAHTLDSNDRKGIRSHAARPRAARRQAVPLRSWLSSRRRRPSRERTAHADPVVSVTESLAALPTPSRVGSDFSGVQLPAGFEPHMIQDLVRLIDLNKHGVYPYEICLDVHPVERGWFPYMMSDPCCLHSMMLSVLVFLEYTSQGQPGRRAGFHYAETLHILQARLDEFNYTSAISDATIMVVITLASAAELTEDFSAVSNHIDGLTKIVSLRGGVRALNTHNNLQVKVCRADLAYALMTGTQPRLLKDEIPWDCFIADRGLVQCSHQPHEANIRTFAKSALDAPLYNVLRDLHAFSCISNLAYQTTRKLSPDTYNQVMISILYRLTHLSYENDPVPEVIRLGLLVYSSTIFIQRHFMGQTHDHLLNLYTRALLKLHNHAELDVPVSIVFWLTTLSHVTTHKAIPPADWRNTWIDQTILSAGISSWPQASDMLRSMIWVDFIHSQPGKQVFEAARVRREKAAQFEVEPLYFPVVT